MIFKISHITEYSYSDKVFFEPHIFRFKPKHTPHLTLKDFTINIAPEASGFSEQTDIENNHNLFCWFDETHTKLKINAYSLVEAQENNPFNFLVHPPEYLQIPFDYDNNTNQLLKPSLIADDLSKEVTAYLKGILSDTNHRSVDFLVELTKNIHQDFTLESRETGNPYDPNYTFKKKVGSCRDLAWMQIHMLRYLGIATRFVSGYYFVEVENPTYELHAWVEVYLPGAGWIGLDPGHGILTSTHHIPVASSAFYTYTMPVSGIVRGNPEATLKHELKIDRQPF
ncbi:MAG: transglutaminase N-terminal domain-containing protein [Thermonemataceae bacterium]